MESGQGHGKSAGIEQLLQTIIDGQERISNAQEDARVRMEQMHTDHALLQAEVKRMDEDLRGRDGKGGVVRKVAEHDTRINRAIGGMTVLSVIGAGVGYCADSIVRAIKGH